MTDLPPDTGVRSGTVCPSTGDRHIPEWMTISLMYGSGSSNNTIERIDILCANCKRTGCVGSTSELEETIEWEE